MKPVSNIIDKFLDGKPIFTPIRRILNLIFIASISSYFFENYSGKYEWLNYNDYKGILDFFIKGVFIIPLSIFLTVNYVTFFISSNILPAIILKKSLKYQDVIRSVNLRLENIDIGENLNEDLLIEKNSKKYLPIPNCLLDLYQIISAPLKERITFEKFKLEINRDKKEIQLTLNLLLRAIIAIILYFIQLPTLGTRLFIFLLFTIIIITIVCICGLLLLNTLPFAIQKLKFEMEGLLELRRNNPTTD